jgi:regulator of sigma E protease
MAVADDDNYNLKNAHIQIMTVLPGSPAEIAGLKAGDKLINFQRIADFHQFIDDKIEEEITLTVKRGKDIYEKKMTAAFIEGQEGKLIGVASVRVGFRTYPWYKAPAKGALETWDLTGQVIAGWAMGLKSIFGVASLPEGVKMEMMGPLGIFNLLTEYAGLGASYFLSLVSLISVALALSNLLPIPALDGGKMLFLAIEFFKGSPINEKIEQRITTVFFVALIILMAFITFKFDIPRIF